MTRLDKLVALKAILSFISDSCNVMNNVRSFLAEQKVERWIYTCAAHCHNNLCKEIQNICFKNVTKEEIFLYKKSWTSTSSAGFLRRCVKNYVIFCTAWSLFEGFLIVYSQDIQHTVKLKSSRIIPFLSSATSEDSLNHRPRLKCYSTYPLYFTKPNILGRHEPNSAGF